ncbi:hypothetical protein POM88_019625 [Heracleum sosnowskyi]|uniref:F-box associated beta-propeller type 3 domain-containing protein n=1 Tax=Heracleum sosnowskyi TaxID=360622 RepID=A0AAD8IAI6_9APIA|nr:hypothetical protein POM88_019625 [Heracleum sosnowskyi]
MAIASVLPAETIEFEILPRLPVKSLLRFKSVFCKSWNSLISSRDFIKSVRNSNHDSLTLICMRNNSWDCQVFTYIIGCIDGLVCFSNDYKDGRTTMFKIWNPATKQCLEIEPPPQGFDFETQGWCDFGFGFDSVTNDYKIICVVLEEQQPLVGYIYSCNSGCWSKITPSNFLHQGDISPVPFIFNGSPFWLVSQTRYGKESLTIISCDVRDEIFRLLPDLVPTDKSCNSNLMKFRDSLAVMFYDAKLFSEETINIYIFDERCENWSKTSIGSFKIWNPKPTSLTAIGFLGCSNRDDILFLYPFIYNKYCVRPGYAIKSVGEVLKNYTIKSPGKEVDLYIDLGLGLTDYSESLVFIDGMKPCSGTEDEIRYYYLQRKSRFSGQAFRP